MPSARAKPLATPVDFTLPTRGLFTGSAWSKIPEGFTPDVSNCFPFDALGRQRISKRPGSSKYWSFQFGGGAKFVQHLSYARVQNTTSGASNTYVIVVCGGRAYRQLPGDLSAVRIDGGSTDFSTGRKVSAVTYQNSTYFTDGLVNKVYDHDAGTWGDWTAATGTFPVANSQYPRVLAVWRGRIVLTHLDKGLASTIFFTAQGNPRDFDYGAAPVTATIAVATDDNFKAGQLGAAATALIPANEDYLYVGTENSLHVFRGDPADGGSLVPVSSSVGILSDRAWCMVNSTIYFVGTGGLYKLSPGGEPICISKWPTNATYRDLPQVGWYIDMAYDKQRHGIWIFVTHELTTFQTRHMFYDLRAEEQYQVGGFWPQAFPVDTGGDNEASGTTAPTHGPTKVLSFDGADDATDARVVLLGGRDGYVRKMDDSALNDDGQAVNSYCWIGPMQAAGATEEFMINGHFPNLGEQSANVTVDWTLQGGHDPYQSYAAGTNAKTGTYTTGGRQSPRGDRLTANSVWLKVANTASGKTFSIERWTALVEPAGPNR